MPQHAAAAYLFDVRRTDEEYRDYADMPRGYWVTFYRSVSNPAALAEYAALARPAIEAGGGRFLARDTATQVFEGGLQQRVVIIEFDSLERALRTYQSSAYQSALRRLKGAAERDVRIIEGMP